MQLNESTIEFRPARDSDIAAVLSFWRLAAEDAHRPVDTAAAIARLIRRDPDALLLAIDPGHTSRSGDGQGDLHPGSIVGTVIAGWDGWRCHVYRLAVHPDHRRRGLASTLLTLCERRFADLGGGRVDAMVLRANGTAQQLWTRAGYRSQSEWARWVKPLVNQDGPM